MVSIFRTVRNTNTFCENLVVEIVPINFKRVYTKGRFAVMAQSV